MPTTIINHHLRANAPSPCHVGTSPPGCSLPRHTLFLARVEAPPPGTRLAEKYRREGGSTAAGPTPACSKGTPRPRTPAHHSARAITQTCTATQTDTNARAQSHTHSHAGTQTQHAHTHAHARAHGRIVLRNERKRRKHGERSAI